MIYGRVGNKVTIVRMATIEDVTQLDHRKPDKVDRQAIKNASYVVVEDDDTKKLRLYHQAFLRADRGAIEIEEAILACEVKPHLRSSKRNGGQSP
jgi:hypothetical protein